MKIESSFRTVKEYDDVYWNEVDHYDENHNPVYATHNGYYLASYHMGKEIYHIVSFHQITSCVVRHIKAFELFTYREDAERECNLKNKLTHQHEDKGE